jgi:hypothetical protein
MAFSVGTIPDWLLWAITGKVQRPALKKMSSTAAPAPIIDPTAAAILYHFNRNMSIPWERASC